MVSVEITNEKKEMNALYIDIYKDQMLPIELFGRQVLYTKHPIAREEVPEGWCCYDLCGTDRKPNQSLKLTDAALIYHTGTVLSPRPLKRSTTLERKGTVDKVPPNRSKYGIIRAGGARKCS